MKYFGDVSSVYGDDYLVHDDGPMDAIERLVSSEEQTSCFYHLSVDSLVARVKTWRLLLPRVRPHYAVKCNPDPSVLRTFALMGIGFDCASKQEMSAVLGLGVAASRIVFAHTIKVASALKYAKLQGVRRMTFDSAMELHKIARLYPSAHLLIRIRCDATSVMCPLGMKFGVLPGDARPLLQLAAELGLSVRGVAFHVGSGCSEPQVFLRAIAKAKEVFVEAEEFGHSPDVLDIGGGFLGGADDNLKETAGYINEALEEHFPDGCGVDVIAEPGRYMVSSAFTLATPIISRRDVNAESTSLFIDDGLYGSFNCIMYEGQKVSAVVLDDDLTPVVPAEECEGACAEDTMEATVWGPTCDSIDKVLSRVRVPRGLTAGQWLVWRHMGAYTLAAASGFNGFPRPSVLPHLSRHALLLLQGLLEQSHSAKSADEEELSSGVASDEEAAAPPARRKAAQLRSVAMRPQDEAKVAAFYAE